ncbi:MAG: methyltransferase domain-containing protein [Pseudomonadota bacterium]
MQDQFKFLRQWATAPLQVAAVTPSGRSLARLMAQEVRPGVGPVIELGPGTGVFTRAMIEQGVPEDRIALIELNPAFAADLARRFPKAQIHNVSAAGLAEMCPFDRKAAAVLSGLGLLSMPQLMVEAILRGVFFHLRPGGAFVQFTYGLRCPVPPEMLRDLGLRARRAGGTWRNLPPAAVYTITRTSDRRQMAA